MIMPASPSDPRDALKHFVQRLLSTEWEDPSGPLRLNGNLSLLDFGLVETQKASRDWPGIGEKDRIRATTLFYRFLQFRDQP